jgi:undecaprenyl-diphosphatase
MNELQIVEYFNRLGLGTHMDLLTVFISFIPFMIALWLVMILLAIIFDKKRGWMVLVSVAIAMAFYLLFSDFILKHAILAFYPMRVRPYLAHPGDIILVARKAIIFGKESLNLTENFRDSSFPSGHMGSSLAVFTVFVYYYRKIWPLVLVFVLFMAYSRMHLGMHYPTDVLTGTVLGIICGLLAVLITKRIFRKKAGTKKLKK